MPSLASIKLDLHLALAIDEFSTLDQPREPIMEIKRPMELAGLKSRLQRAAATEKAIAITGKRYDKVLDEIDELHGVSISNVGQLEAYKSELKSTIERMTAGSNGGPNDDGQDGQTSGETVDAGAKDTAEVKPPAVEPAPQVPVADGTIPEFKISG